ncbi:ammonium transporter [Pontiella agarivorans]|uniref:Ammonium transporter n=1 Tax=Pontiella agarivorans TaxID=3038953 RepID=A0ABU5MY96_9BACT|nr:ammonium transporter [Pontiella agarivorans]MDZ8118946.1 ammonium transporter [Pontiella agarivorans]
MKWLKIPTLIAAALVFGLASPALAQEAADAQPVFDAAATAGEWAYAIDNMFLMFCAVLVLFMQAGFALVESGFNSAKNTVNILFKNLMDLSIGMVLYFIIGYGLMYPGDGNGFLAFGQFGIGGNGADVAEAGALTLQVDWLFQVAFAATAATIVSGAVAGRLKFSAYLVYSAVLTAIIYPISGYWKWGGGWLDQMGFYDFAGSLVVHACGGFAALAGAIVLGPRIGRFTKEGKAKAMPGHSLPLATLGVFILLIGWFGFNPGSQLAIVGKGNTEAVMLIAVNTLLAAGAGAVLAMVATWIMHKKPDLTMAANGVLAGLVGITANCDGVTNVEAIIIGAIAGVLVVAGVKLLDKLKIDDPVGAFPVHGLCGVWGGIATALFGEYSDGYGNWIAQITGSIAIPLWAFATMFILFTILKAVGMLRVSKEEELRGLDIGEHGEEAYNGFQIFTTN